MRHRWCALLGLLVVLAAGCGGDETSALSGATFSGHSGCGDTFLYATDTGADGRELVLDVNLPDLLAGGDGTRTLTFVGEDTDVDGPGFPTASLTLGRFIAALRCNDAIERDPVEEATWRAVEGTAEATVRVDTEEQCCGPMGFVDVVVRDLVLEGERGTVTIEEVVFTDVFVGWFAG